MEAPRSTLLLTLAFLLIGPPLSAPAGAGEAPEALLESIRASRLDRHAAVNLESAALDAGVGQLIIEKGTLFPAAVAEDGTVVEMVFIGRARLFVDPPDAIEAGQLERFTGSRRFDEPVTEAVLVVGDERASAALFDRPTPEEVEPERFERARELLARWRVSAERRHLALEASVLLTVLGEPGYEDLFAGWFRSEELGRFLYLVEPDEAEQVSLGRFVPVDVESGERRRLERTFHRQRRRGRMLGLRVDDLGEWTPWLSAVRGRPGRAPFEPERYEIEADLEGRKLLLRGRCRVTLEPQGPGRRVVPFRVSPDLEVTAARDGEGRELFFLPSPGRVTVILAEPAPTGRPTVVELEYRGNPTEKVDTKSFVLRDTTGWYPHTGLLDRAAYDVTLRWPRRLDLVAPGRRVDGGRKGRMQWERRVVDLPTFGYSFEVASFDRYTARAGDVEVELYLDFYSSPLVEEWRDEILETVRASLLYFEELFGPFPLDRLTLVTSPRPYSQSLLGFVTLSSVMVGDLGFASFLLPDRRTVIAHEVAHQWWGHVVGWSGYRDQWLSEAMANHAALLFARNRLETKPWRGPTTGWRRALSRTTEDGRPIESLGPVVLGERLATGPDGHRAYEAIVYRKGAVVLDMLAVLFGEDGFNEILGAVARGADFRPLSTEIFFDLVERASGGLDMEPFTRQFVYGTGLPEVYYDYSFEEGDGEGWLVRGVARQQAPYRYEYRVVKLSGGFDVVREAVEQTSVEDWHLVVPVRISVRKPETDEPVPLGGRTLLEGQETHFRFELPHEPVSVAFDPRSRLFARFFDQRSRPKRTLYYRGLDLAAAGDLERAEAAYLEALKSGVRGPRDGEEPDEDDEDLGEAARLLDARILLRLGRLMLDRDRDRSAEDFLDRAE
ncbi:MAG: M1 family metallopeptidase, partial [Acidobacteriota bacterium]